MIYHYQISAEFSGLPFCLGWVKDSLFHCHLVGQTLFLVPIFTFFSLWTSEVLAHLLGLLDVQSLFIPVTPVSLFLYSTSYFKLYSTQQLCL